MSALFSACVTAGSSAIASRALLYLPEDPVEPNQPKRWTSWSRASPSPSAIAFRTSGDRW
jgi:hypothetical protein